MDFYPSAKVRLIIRFDEFGDAKLALTKKVPVKMTTHLVGVKDDRNNLSITSDPTMPPGVKSFLLAGASDKPAQAQDSSTDQLTHVLGGIIPNEAEWCQNGVRAADTLKLTLRYIDCPIDPRTVRSCAVEYYLGTLKEDDFADGISGAIDIGASSYSATSGFTGRPLNLIPDEYSDDNGQKRSNLRFQGWVDKWTVEAEDGQSIIRLDCRDNAQLLIDQQQPPNLGVSEKKPLDEAIADFLSHFPQLQGLTIVYLPTTDTAPVLADSLAKTAFRPNIGGKHASKGAGSDKHSIWDYLTDVCGQVGHMIRVDGTKIIIQRARSLWTNQGQNAIDDPFQGRAMPNGNPFVYRRFIYGRNVENLHTTKNFNKKQVKNIEVRCYDPENKKPVVGRFPLPEDRQAYGLPGDAQPDQKWEVKYVSGIKDDKTARAVAQSYYESLNRHELEIELKTHNLTSFGGKNTDPDVLDMKVGSTFELLTMRNDDDETSAITNIEATLLAEARAQKFIKQLGFSEDFAKAYAKAYTDANFQTAFRLRSMKVDWGVDDGVTMTIQGINYIEVRADKLLPQGEEPGNTAVK